MSDPDESVHSIVVKSLKLNFETKLHRVLLFRPYMRVRKRFPLMIKEKQTFIFHRDGTIVIKVGFDVPFF